MIVRAFFRRTVSCSSIVPAYGIVTGKPLLMPCGSSAESVTRGVSQAAPGTFTERCADALPSCGQRPESPADSAGRCLRSGILSYTGVPASYLYIRLILPGLPEMLRPEDSDDLIDPGWFPADFRNKTAYYGFTAGEAFFLNQPLINPVGRILPLFLLRSPQDRSG